MGIETLEFNNIIMNKKIIINKKIFHKLKQPFDLLSIDTDQILASDKFKRSNEGFKYFIDYRNELVHPICIMLPQMSGYIKYFEYFENGSKNMSF